MKALHGLVDSPDVEPGSFRFTISDPGSVMIEGRLGVFKIGESLVA
jgi:hypothetical protein